MGKRLVGDCAFCFPGRMERNGVEMVSSVEMAVVFLNRGKNELIDNDEST